MTKSKLQIATYLYVFLLLVMAVVYQMDLSTHIIFELAYKDIDIIIAFWLAVLYVDIRMDEETQPNHNKG